MGPLTNLLEAGNSEKVITIEEVMAATTTAVELIGNANARISRLRREKICSHLNKTLQPLAQQDDLFKDAAPALFGTEFAKKSKDHIDQVRAIMATVPKKPQHHQQQFFREVPPRKGGYNKYSRGRGGDSGFHHHTRGGRFQRKTYHPQYEQKAPQGGKN